MKVYRVGVERAGTYGAEVWGLSDTEVNRLRRLAATTLRPVGRGRSLALTLLMAGAPSAMAELSPVIQYHRIVWKGLTNRENSKMRGISLGSIAKWWHDTEKYAGELVDAARYRDGEGHGAADAGGKKGARQERGPTKAWRNVKGPLGAAHLTLARMNWRFVNPFVIEDDRGYEVPLTTMSPAMVKDLLLDGARRCLERRVGRKWATRDPQFIGRGVCVDLALREIGRKGCGMTRKEIGAYRSATCGALMTYSRATAEGYDVHNLCPLCGEAGDTVHHRTYKCVKTRQAVLEKVPRWFYDEAGRKAPHERFWTTAMIPHPGDTVPPPIKDFSVEIEYLTDAACAENCQAAAEGGQNRLLGGQVYTDGSCTTEVIRELRRAGSRRRGSTPPSRGTSARRLKSRSTSVSRPRPPSCGEGRRSTQIV